MTRLLIAAALAAALAWPAAAQQAADPDFHPAVARPAFAAGRGPVVAIDEGHANFHTVDGRYAPFAALLRADGFQVRASRGRFSEAGLRDLRVLVIANATPGEGPDPSAFTPEECAALKRWVEAGGSLLLIADHAPFGSATARLGETFGVGMGQGYLLDGEGRSLSTQIEFSKANGRLGDHAITRGRGPDEAARVVRSFTGQSLTVPPGAVNLMQLSDRAREVPDTDALNAFAAGRGEAAPAKGSSQGLAMTVGKGRVVVLGEAGMFSAQVVTFPDGRAPVRFGMNVTGTDNAQFALNVLHWLAGGF